MTTDPTSTTTGATQIDVQRDSRAIVVSRVFDAPRELVFKAWTEIDRISRWWAPGDWTADVRHLDLRPGGTFHYCFRGPEGEEAWGILTYREIVPPERLVAVDAFSNAEGAIVPPESTWTMTFEEQQGKTRLIHQTQFASVEDFDKVVAMGVTEGIAQVQDNLAAYLASSEARV